MTRNSKLRALLRLAAPVAALACGAAAGCGHSRGSLSIDAPAQSVRLQPALRTSVYRHIDANTADIYLSDLAPEQVASLGDEPGTSGVVVHIHMFMHPKAGRTPIDFDASNTSITVYVLADGATGVYGGGGFLLPSARSGDERLTGRLERATIRLTSSTAGFADRIGVGSLAGTVSAERDDETSLLISRRLTRRALLGAQPAPPQPPTP